MTESMTADASAPTHAGVLDSGGTPAASVAVTTPPLRRPRPRRRTHMASASPSHAERPARVAHAAWTFATSYQ